MREAFSELADVAASLRVACVRSAVALDRAQLAEQERTKDRIAGYEWN